MTISILLVMGGVIGLFLGSHWLVGGSARIASKYGVSPLVIGLTLVAFGTSAPEYLVSLLAAMKDTPELALGNVVGSNIANIGLILGVLGLLRPQRVERRLLTVDLPLVIISGILLCVLGYLGIVDFWGGLGLLLLFAVFLYYCFVKPPPLSELEEVDTTPSKNLLKDGLLIAIGLILLAAGAQGLIMGATDIAEAVGVPKLIIGLTVVAVGTSLPELATTIYAVIKGHDDIGLGNIVGSNIFNTTFVLGGVSVIYDIPVPQEALYVHLPVMMAMSILLIPMLMRSRRLRRWKSGLLLAGYTFYIVAISLHPKLGAATNEIPRPKEVSDVYHLHEDR